MRTASGLLAWSLWLCAVHGAPAPKSSGSDGLCAAAMLKVGLHPVETSVDISESANAMQLVFSIYNPTSNPITLLKRGTPLDGMKTSMFRVRNPGGKVMQYRGKEARRAAPRDEEYIVIAPAAIEKKVFALSEYEFTGDGKYSIAFTKPLRIKCGHGHRQLQTASPEAEINIQFTDAHEKRFETGQKARLARKLNRGGGRRAITYHANCDAVEQENLVKWTADAEYKIAAARSCTETSCATLVDTWFGATTTQGEFAAVTAVFDTMATKTQDSLYNCPDNDPPHGCDSSTFAYVFPDDATQEIFMCPLLMSYPDYAEQVQTVVHELSHFTAIGATTDDAYGQQACWELANVDPNGVTTIDGVTVTNVAAARLTADTYGYFAIYTSPVCFPNARSNYEPVSPPCNKCQANVNYPNAGATQNMACPPTKAPTKTPTKTPTKSPTKTPTNAGQTYTPTKAPTNSPTSATKAPTKAPTTKAPTHIRTDMHTTAPTLSPPTVPPTPAPTPSHTVKFKVRLDGCNCPLVNDVCSDCPITVVRNWGPISNTAVVQQAFMSTVATNAGKYCGMLGLARCTSPKDVVVDAVENSITRRSDPENGLLVDYTLMVPSKGAATSAALELMTYMQSQQFIDDLGADGSKGLGNVSAVAILQSSTQSNMAESDGGVPYGILIVSVVVVISLGVGIIVYCRLSSKQQQETDDESKLPADGAIEMNPMHSEVGISMSRSRQPLNRFGEPVKTTELEKTS